MASEQLYPPTLEVMSDAFRIHPAADSEGKQQLKEVGTCEVYFSPSIVSSTNINEVKSLHFTIVDQNSVTSAVDKVDLLSEEDLKINVFRKTGIVMVQEDFSKLKTGVMGSSGKIMKVDDNTYKLLIFTDDIKGGWSAGSIYKVQIRLSLQDTPSRSDSSLDKQWAYLNTYANKFSEWSTCCTVKAIHQPAFKYTNFNFDVSQYGAPQDDTITVDSSNIIHRLTYTRPNDLKDTHKLAKLVREVVRITKNGVTTDTILDEWATFDYPNDSFTLEALLGFSDDSNKESLYSYNVEVFLLVPINKNENQRISQYKSEDIIASYNNGSKMFYEIPYKLTAGNEAGCDVVISVSYTTNNKYRHTQDIQLDISVKELTNIKIDTYDTAPSLFPKDYSLFKEEEEGRIGIAIHGFKDGAQSTYRIRRASAKNNFEYWEELMTVQFSGDRYKTGTGACDIFYDYTAESGTMYRYSLLKVSANNENAGFVELPKNAYVVREFEHSYLVGNKNKQLNLKFSNAIASFKYTISETSLETIGGVYPIFSRNANMNYRQFQLSGYIAYEMDEENTFTDDDSIFYGMAKQYKDNEERLIFTKQKLFRDKAIEFLQDGKGKLFKSATEGNILIRLMNVSLTPEQSLSRMIYKFSANCYECGADKASNYFKFGVLKRLNDGYTKPDIEMPLSGGGSHPSHLDEA